MTWKHKTNEISAFYIILDQLVLLVKALHKLYTYCFLSINVLYI